MDHKELLNYLKDTAKQVLVEALNLSPMFFFVNERAVIPVQLTDMLPANIITEKISDDQKKILSYNTAGAFANASQIDYAAIVYEGAFISRDRSPVDVTELALSYPKSMRTECIAISVIDIKSKKSSTIIVPFKGGEKEPVQFIGDEINSDDPKGSSLFFDEFFKGYNEYEKIKKETE